MNTLRNFMFTYVFVTGFVHNLSHEGPFSVICGLSACLFYLLLWLGES